MPLPLDITHGKRKISLVVDNSMRSKTHHCVWEVVCLNAHSKKWSSKQCSLNFDAELALYETNKID